MGERPTGPDLEDSDSTETPLHWMEGLKVAARRVAVLTAVIAAVGGVLEIRQQNLDRGETSSIAWEDVQRMGTMTEREWMDFMMQQMGVPPMRY